MENLIFSLNATVPIFLLMVIGYFLHKIGLYGDKFAKRANQFVFKIALPVMLFKELATADFASMWDTGYVGFCFLATFGSILLAVIYAKLFVKKNVQGEFAQAAYRSSAALLGCAFIQNIYNEAGPAPLMIIGTVPLYNIAAVVILNLMKEENAKLTKDVAKTTLKGIVTNPIIIGIALGFVWSVLKLPMITVMNKTLTSVSNLATPLGLMTLGATFDFSKAKGSIKDASICSLFKLVICAAIFIPIAVALGYREAKLVSILVMLGGATTVSCFVMAENLGHEGTLTSSVVVITTIFSAFTLTGWLYMLKSLAYI